MQYNEDNYNECTTFARVSHDHMHIVVKSYLVLLVKHVPC